MADVVCQIDGLENLERLLTELAPKEAKTALRRAERKSAVLFQEEIERLAPKDTDFLSEHISIRSKAGAGDDDGSTGSIAVTIGPTVDIYPPDVSKRKRDAAEVARFHELGTIHEPAKPFISVAYEDKKDEVVSAFQTELAAAIEALNK
jgi:HK97 gp10 family phage protein